MVSYLFIWTKRVKIFKLMSQMFDLNVKNTNWNENSCSYLCKMINNSVLKSCFQYYLLLLNIIEDWVMGQITTYILKNIIRLNTTIKKKSPKLYKRSNNSDATRWRFGSVLWFQVSSWNRWAAGWNQMVQSVVQTQAYFCVIDSVLNEQQRQMWTSLLSISKWGRNALKHHILAIFTFF